MDKKQKQRNIGRCTAETKGQKEERRWCLQMQEQIRGLSYLYKLERSGGLKTQCRGNTSSSRLNFP